MSKTKKVSLSLLALVCVFALAMSCMFVTRAGADAGAVQSIDGYDYYFCANDVDIDDYTDVMYYADGNVILKGTVDTPLSVDSNSKSAKELKDPDNTSFDFSRRVKTNGKTDHTNLARSIILNVEHPAQIDVYAFSASSSDPTRTIALYKNGGTKVATSDPLATEGATIEATVFDVAEPGCYYIAADVNGVGIYFVGVKYTDTTVSAPARASWNSVATPSIQTITPAGGKVTVAYSGVIGANGADQIVVKMYEKDGGLVDQSTAVKYGQTGSVVFSPDASGTFYYTAEATRSGEVTAIVSDNSEYSNFILPFTKPSVRARTSAVSGENMIISATIAATPEADVYTLSYKLQSETEYTTQTINASDFTDGTYVFNLPASPVNTKFDIFVDATRNKDTDNGGIIPTTETLRSDAIVATVRPDVERDWEFATFGQSTKRDYNYISENGNIYDGFTLNTCVFDPNTGRTLSKGGKFTYGSHDGISYYYTKINAEEEDFRIRADIKVEYINPTPDGQEGFAILVRDSIGVDGDAAYYYTNSAAAIATKIQYKQGAANVNVKDGLGTRFVTGIQSTTEAPSVVNQVMYPLNGNTLIAKGSTYTLEVEKVNNCYYVRYIAVVFDEENPLGVEKVIAQKCLYYGVDGENKHYDQLRVIDKDNVYVGFACARGLNAKFSNIQFETSPRSNEVVEIVKEKVVGDYSVTSPTTSSLKDYNFNFFSNADGKLTVSLNGTEIVTAESITNYTDFYKKVELNEGMNTFDWTFDPNDDFCPSLNEEMETYVPQSGTWTVNRKCFFDANTPIYVAPDDAVTQGDSYKVKELKGKAIIGKSNATGTLTDPLELQTALNYVLPGQKILMFPGEYHYNANVTVEKGNDGYYDSTSNTTVYKYLMPASFCDTRPVINFQEKGTGIKMWGNYWHMYGFDITGTKFASKAIQIYGSNNILENVVAHHNGDSGIAVSGRSTDAHEKWPDNNLIKNCTAYMNKDQAEEDADGFAAKLYCGEGNKFVGCIAYCNADDGWDLYAKTESGTIGAVTIEDSVAFGNGFNTDGETTDGNGNGFKLGGESLPGAHVLRRSISFGNKLKGIDSNSCPDDFVYNCTSVYNGRNYAFYSTLEAPRFTVSNSISLIGFKSDDIASQSPSLYKPSNYFFAGNNMVGKTSNSDGTELQMTIFKGWSETTTAKDYFLFDFNGTTVAETGEDKGFFPIINKVTVRNADDSINMNGILELKDSSVAYGAKLRAITRSETIVAPAVERTEDYVPGGNSSNSVSASTSDSAISSTSSEVAPTSEKSGCFSTIDGSSYLIGFVVLTVLAIFLAKKQSKKN